MPPKPKQRLNFLCSDCGHTSPKWEGRCPVCGAWGTYAEFSEAKRSLSTARPVSAGRFSQNATGPADATPLTDQLSDDEPRVKLGMPEVDRLLGGGVVAGSVMLLAGEPGIGKSTLLLQLAAKIAISGSTVLYISGEESGLQVGMRASRIGASVDNLLFSSETSIEKVLDLLDSKHPALVIIDSIQTLASDDSTSGAGSVSQVRDCALALLGWAKSMGVPLLLAGHVTKDGNIAGPRVLEHIVDVVLHMDGDELGSYRMLRCTKNRFGSTNDVALFEMGGDGLTEVSDPSAALIAERQRAVPGSAVIVTMEGSRPLLSEVQALTTLSTFSPPRRTANGVDFNRMIMLSAVLTRRARVGLGNQDIMVNVPGGMKMNEPAGDLGIALSLASSHLDLPLNSDTVFLGEIGLNGEIRRVPQVERRLWEAVRHGFHTAIVPRSSVDRISIPPSMKIIGVDNLRAAMTESGLIRKGSGQESDSPTVGAESAKKKEIR